MMGSSLSQPRTRVIRRLLSPIGTYIEKPDVVKRELSGEQVQAVKTRYGWVEIDDSRYDHDVVVHLDRSVTKRSKKKSKKYKKNYGHTPLTDHDLEFLEKENPAVVFIGTGQYGDLTVTVDAHRILMHYESIIRPTPEILDLLALESRPFVAILHVTC